ncbi:MAG: SseB family protein [Lachnospiraceae bacterium]
MNQEAQRTEELMKQYKADPSKENLRLLIDQARRTVFLVPALVQSEEDRKLIQAQSKQNPGAQFKLPEHIKPAPTIIKNKEGLTFLAIYTSAPQIPKEPKSDIMMNMPFRGAYLLALNEKMNISGIVLNPFSENLLFNKDLLTAIRKEEEAVEAGKQQINQTQMTPQQIQVMLRQKAEFSEIPRRLFDENSNFMEELKTKKGRFIHEIYQSVFTDGKLCPYQESEFDLMSLNISEQLQLTVVDLPEIKTAALLCYRIYITNNPVSGEVHYFTIEKGRDKGELNLGSVDSEGRHTVYGPAPVEGAEISRIMELIQNEQNQVD